MIQDMRWVSHFSDDYSLQDEEKMQINLFFLKLFQDIMKADEWDSPSYLPEAYKELAEYLLQEQAKKDLWQEQAKTSVW